MAGQAGAAGRRSILVPTGLAARQWEVYYAEVALAAGQTAWATPPIHSYDAWLEQRWLEASEGEQGVVLTPNQSAALWGRIVAESPVGAELIGHTGAAEWAAAAFTLLQRWQVSPTALRAASDEADFRALLGWCHRYLEVLAAHSWRDRAQLEAALTSYGPVPGERLVAADLDEPHPARSTLFARWRAGGALLDTELPRSVGRWHRAARLADATHELRAALGWANERQRARPGERLAIVVPLLPQRLDEVARLAGAELETTVEVWIDGATLAHDPTVGAALTGLALLDPAVSYATFGRWLRSPMFGAAEEHAARARLDRELRGELRSQLPFGAAYRRAGVRERLLAEAPATGAALDRALALHGAITRAAPSRWAHLWTRILAELGWQPPPARSALKTWQSALDELARLTPILGELSLPAALAELTRLVDVASRPPLPLTGVHVLARIEDVGPGYDGAWVTGLTDAFWPKSTEGNPLLPLALQRACGMPYSSPQDAERRSAALLARLIDRVPELVVSSPARVHDYEAEPSPALRGWEMFEANAVGSRRAGRIAQALETVVDTAPALATERIAGGTGALGRQARCPLRAFCQDRLRARPLEPLSFGVTARLRGLLSHRAAELLFAGRPAQAELATLDAAAIAASVAQALTERFGPARRPLQALFELEAALLKRTLTDFLQVEMRRETFRVHALEHKTSIAVGDWMVDVRIDRIDQLGDGTYAIIDYKTNEQASAAQWFGARVRDAQVPLYAAYAGLATSAAVIARLKPSGSSYAGTWSEAAFPGRRSLGAHPEFRSQLEIWRAQIANLAAEFAAGDTRILLPNYADATEAYAPLTRVFELLGSLGAPDTQP